MAYLVAFGRWGSHVHLPATSIYITDVALVIAALVWWRAWRGCPREALRSLLVVRLVVAIAALGLVRLVAGGSLSVVALRDAAPYGYAVAAVLPLAPARSDASERSLRVLRAAMIVRLVLVSLVLVFPAVVDHMPAFGSLGPDSRVLSLRADFDSAILVTLAVTGALRLLRDHGAWRRAAVEGAIVCWSVLAILFLGSRAGLLALMLGSVLVCTAGLWPRLRVTRVPTRLALACAAALLLFVAVPRVPVFERLTDTAKALGIGRDPTQKVQPATGTATARLYAWDKTADYIAASPSRSAVGVGFGPNFLEDSGAAEALEGETYSGVRAPHSFFLNTWARLGFVGLALVVLAFAQILGTGLRRLRRLSDLEFTCLALFVSVLVVASLGVVLEAPFGAVPAFWAAGVLLAGSKRNHGPDPVTTTSQAVMPRRGDAVSGTREQRHRSSLR